MAITYRTVIKNAIDGFNNIQKKINANSGQLKNITVSGTAVSDVLPVGAYDDTDGSTTGTILGALQPATFSVSNPAAITLSASSLSGVSLGTSAGTYSVTLSGSSSYSYKTATAGLVKANQSIASGNATIGNKKYINIDSLGVSTSSSNLTGTNSLEIVSDNSSVNSILTAVDSASGHYIKIRGKSSATAKTQTVSASSAGYRPKDSQLASFSVSYSASNKDQIYKLTDGTVTINASNIGAPTISANTSTTSSGGTNVSTVLGSSQSSAPTSGYFIAMGTNSPSTTVKLSSTAGYIPASTTSSPLGSKSISVNQSTQYFTITSAAASVGGGTLSGSNISPTISISGLTISVSGSSDVTHNKGSASITTAGYLGASSQITVGGASKKTISVSGTQTITSLTVPISTGLSLTLTGNTSSDGTGLTITNGQNRNINITNGSGTTKINGGAASAENGVTVSGKTVYVTTGSSTQKQVTSTTGVLTAGSATTPTASAASTSTSLSGTTITVKRSVTPSVTEGWVSGGTAGTVTITATVPTQDKSASAAGNITPDTGKLLTKVTVGAGSATPSAAVTGSATALNSTTAMNNQYFSVVPKASVGTAGWIASISNGATVNYKVKDANITNVATSGVTYNASTTAANSSGNIYINAGWIGNTVISLGSIIPDDSAVADADSSQMLYGYEAYNTAGARKIGNIKTYKITNSPGNSEKQLSATYFSSSSGVYELSNGYIGSAVYIKSGSAGNISGGGLTHGNTTFTAGTSYLTDTNTGYAITASNTASRAAASYSVTAGWISSAGSGLSATDNSVKAVTKYIIKGAAHNGYVTTAGWIPTNTNNYTLSYNSGEQCVDFIFNN